MQTTCVLVMTYKQPRSLIDRNLMQVQGLQLAWVNHYMNYKRQLPLLLLLLLSQHTSNKACVNNGTASSLTRLSQSHAGPGAPACMG
jgi:hypothetical protein